MYKYRIEDLDDFARKVNNVYTLGYITQDGMMHYSQIMNDRGQGDFRLDVLQSLVQLSSLEGIYYDDIEKYIRDTLTPLLYTDHILDTYGTLSYYGGRSDVQSMIPKYDSRWILFIFFKLLSVYILQGTNKIIMRMSEEQFIKEDALRRSSIKEEVLQNIGIHVDKDESEGK